MEILSPAHSFQGNAKRGDDVTGHEYHSGSQSYPSITHLPDPFHSWLLLRNISFFLQPDMSNMLHDMHSFHLVLPRPLRVRHGSRLLGEQQNPSDFHLQPSPSS